MSPPALELRGVSRLYGAVRALAPTSLLMEPGTVVVVEGDNGSGKSTLLRLAAGLLRPSSGARECAGPALYLRPDGGGRAVEHVRDAVAFTAALAGDSSRAVVALENAGLAELGGRRVGSLSSGQRARLMLAHLEASGPALACLDEPTAHLDADGAQRVADTVAAAAAGGTSVLVATHDPGPLLDLRPTRLVLRRGHVAVRAPEPGPATVEDTP